MGKKLWHEDFYKDSPRSSNEEQLNYSCESGTSTKSGHSIDTNWYDSAFGFVLKDITTGYYGDDDYRLLVDLKGNRLVEIKEERIGAFNELIGRIFDAGYEQAKRDIANTALT